MEKDCVISYWRKRNGMEVDFVIEGPEILIETKISDNIKSGDLNGIRAFTDEFMSARNIVVSNVLRKRHITLSNSKVVEIYPWESFLKDLWKGKIF